MVAVTDLLLQLLLLLDVLLQLILQAVVPTLQDVVLAFQFDFTELCRFSQLHVRTCFTDTQLMF